MFGCFIWSEMYWNGWYRKFFKNTLLKLPRGFQKFLLKRWIVTWMINIDIITIPVIIMKCKLMPQITSLQHLKIKRSVTIILCQKLFISIIYWISIKKPQLFFNKCKYEKNKENLWQSKQKDLLEGDIWIMVTIPKLLRFGMLW